MTRAIQLELLAAILGVLVVIAGLLARGGDNRPIEITPADQQLQKKMIQKSMPPTGRKAYLVP